jgi:hypothetical protein
MILVEKNGLQALVVDREEVICALSTPDMTHTCSPRRRDSFLSRWSCLGGCNCNKPIAKSPEPSFLSLAAWACLYILTKTSIVLLTPSVIIDSIDARFVQDCNDFPELAPEPNSTIEAHQFRHAALRPCRLSDCRIPGR